MVVLEKGGGEGEEGRGGMDRARNLHSSARIYE